VSNRTAASRYAKALLDVVATDAEAGVIERDLVRIAGTVSGHAELRQALTTPSVPVAARRRLIGAIADRENLSAASRRLLDLLAERDRLGMLDELLAVYRERLLARRRIQRAEVRSAAPLSPEVTAAIGTRLGAATGTTVEVDAVVDPTLIGGVVTTVGSTVYDGSVRTQLDKLRKQLVGQA
jgi:F-type H+-transporting ATPase subunit delta